MKITWNGEGTWYHAGSSGKMCFAISRRAGFGPGSSVLQMDALDWQWGTKQKQNLVFPYPILIPQQAVHEHYVKDWMCMHQVLGKRYLQPTVDNDGCLSVSAALNSAGVGQESSIAVPSLLGLAVSWTRQQKYRLFVRRSIECMLRLCAFPSGFLWKRATCNSLLLGKMCSMSFSSGNNSFKGMPFSVHTDMRVTCVQRSLSLTTVRTNLTLLQQWKGCWNDAGGCFVPFTSNYYWICPNDSCFL